MSRRIESGLVLNAINLQTKIQRQVGGSLSAHGIGLSEYLVLNQLYKTPTHKMRRRDLAEEVGLSPSGITRLINPMEKIGLVEKEENPRDARVSLVALSTAGKKIYEEAQVSFAQASSGIFESLSPKQINALDEILTIIA